MNLTIFFPFSGDFRSLYFPIIVPLRATFGKHFSTFEKGYNLPYHQGS